MNVSSWLRIVEMLGAEIIRFTPLAPVADKVVAAIQAVEVLHTAPGTGAQKKAAVKDIVAASVEVENAVVGGEVIDPVLATAAADHAIDAVISVANLIRDLQHKTAGGPITPAATATH